MRYLVPLCVLSLAGCTGTFPGLAPQPETPNVVETAPSQVVDPNVIDPNAPLSTSPQASTTAMSPVARPADLKIAQPVVEKTELPPPPKPVVTNDTLGTTVVSLGDPTQPGIWIKTPLVKSGRKGRIVAPSGKEVVADFIPLGGPVTAGSQISLQAMQALGLSLTDLHTVALKPL